MQHSDHNHTFQHDATYEVPDLPMGTPKMRPGGLIFPAPRNRERTEQMDFQHVSRNHLRQTPKAAQHTNDESGGSDENHEEEFSSSDEEMVIHKWTSKTKINKKPQPPPPPPDEITSRPPTPPPTEVPPPINHDWKYGLLGFYHDIFIATMVALLPCAVEAKLVARYSDQYKNKLKKDWKTAGAATFMLILPFVLGLSIFLYLHYCWWGPILWSTVVIILCVFTVVLTVCFLARTAILANTRKAMRKEYDIYDSYANDVCTTFCCYHLALCQMAQEDKYRKKPDYTVEIDQKISVTAASVKPSQSMVDVGSSMA